MRTFLSSFLLFFILQALLACSPKQLEEQALQAYIRDPDNGLTQQMTVNGTSVRLTYRPTDLLVAQEIKAQSVNSEKQIDSIRSYYQGRAYFIMHLSKNGQEIESQYLQNQVVYNQVLQYFNYGLASDIELVTTAGKRAKPLGQVYSRMFGSTNVTSLMLVFDRSELDDTDKFKVVFNGAKLGIGKCSFPFEYSAMNKIPSLKI